MLFSWLWSESAPELIFLNQMPLAMGLLHIFTLSLVNVVQLSSASLFSSRLNF